MSAFLAVLLGVFIVVYAGLGVIVLRQPLVGRLALREAVRRPSQTAILVVGLMIAGASIFAVQVWTDSSLKTTTALDLATWGREDVEITGSGAYFDPSLASRLAADPKVSADAAAIQNAVVLTTSLTDVDRNLGKPAVQVTGLDLSAQHRFGPFVLNDGTRTQGAELTADRVFITRPLADALGAQSGDHLQVNGVTLVVAGIVQRSEAGAYGAYRSLFASLETAQHVAGTTRVNLIRISALGDGDSEVANGHRMVSSLTTALTGNGLAVLESKRGALDAEQQTAASGRAAFTSLALIVALAASAMIVNLAVMLADERRPRLAVLRALGLTRTGLVKVAVVEGGIYSLAGAIAGLPLGLAVGMVLNSTLQVTGPDGTPTQLAVQPSSLLGSVAAAALLTLTTLFITSLRTSRMAISSAIRDLPEPPRPRRTSRMRLALLAACALAGVALLLAPGPAGRAVGGAVVIASAGGAIRGRISDRARFTAIGAAIAAWAVGFVTLNSHTWGTDNQLPASMTGLAVTVVGASILVAANLPMLERLTRIPGPLGGNVRATLRPALAYTARRPLRSGLVIAAFGLIVAVLTSLAASITSNKPDYSRDAGGYDVRVTAVGTSQLSLPAEVQANVTREALLPSRTFLGPVKFESPGLGPSGGWHSQPMTVFGLTDHQLTSGIVPLISWDPKYRSAAEAWQAIANDPTLVAAPILSGTHVDLQTEKGTLHLTVIALEGGLSPTGSVVNGLMASDKIFDWLASSTPGVVLLLTAAPGTTPRALADRVQRATLTQGADATTTRQILDDAYASGKGFVNLLLALMRVGLLVGVFSLGTIALRAVVERRRAIGVLRAIGFAPAQVLLGILVETLLTATAGVAVGTAASYSIGSATLVGGKMSAFAPDPGTVWPAIGVVFAAVFLVTMLPAVQASRLRPAEALRTVA